MKAIIAALLFVSMAHAGGLKIQSLEKGGIYEKLGLKQGDVIRAINGKPMNNQKDVLEVTSRMKTTDKIEIELVRDGLTKKMIYQIQSN